MSYYTRSGVILGLHFSDKEWIASDPDFFYTAREVPVDIPASCDHPDARGYKFCPTCGKKYKPAHTKLKNKKDWHRDPMEMLNEVTGIDVFAWTDRTDWFYGLGMKLMDFREPGEIGVVQLNKVSFDDMKAVEQKIRDLGWFSEEFIKEHIGTWYINGGS